MRYVMILSRARCAALSLLACLALPACESADSALDPQAEIDSALFGGQPAGKSRLPRLPATARAIPMETAADGAMASLPFGDVEGDGCDARCGADPICRARCVSEHLSIADDESDNCLLCGRETGFRGRPDLEVERVGRKSVRLRWTAVDGADRYALEGHRWSRQGDRPVAAYEWIVRGTEVRLRLERGYVYTFTVYGERTADGARSRPSKPVAITL